MKKPRELDILMDESAPKERPGFVHSDKYFKAIAALQKIFDETEGRGKMQHPTTDTQPILEIAYDTLKELGELK